MIRKLFLIFVCMWVLCGCASATDYYVSPTGTGDGLTIETPGDPSVLDASLVAGDTMYFRGGTYSTDERIIISADGTAENPITITNYNNEVPFLVGNHSDTNSKIVSLTGDYITISNLSMTDYYYGFYAVGCQYITFDNLTTNNTYAQAVQFDDCSYSVLKNSHINSITGSGDSIQAVIHNFEKTHHVTFENNTITGNQNHNAIDLFNSASNASIYLADIFIRNNTVSDNYGGAALYMHGTPTLMKRIYIENNTLTQAVSTQNTDLKDSIVRDNIIHSMMGNCIVASTAPVWENVTYYNNTAYNNTGENIYLKIGNETTINFYDDNVSSYRFSNKGYAVISNNKRSSYTVRLDYSTNPNNATVSYPSGRVFSTTVSNANYGTFSNTSYSSSGSSANLNSSGGANTPTFTVTSRNYSAIPATGTATITPRTPVGSEECNFTANSTNGNLVTFAVWDLTPGYQYSIEEDGVQKSTQIANATGYITWNNDAWSEHVYTVEDTGLRLPVCAFTANVTDGTAPETVQFTDASTQTPTSWSWDFNGDDVEDSTEQNPVWTYDTDGSYDVSLTVTNAIGSDTELKEDYIILTNPYVAPVILTTVAAALLFMRARRRW